MFDEETAAKLKGKDAEIILALQEGLEKRAKAKTLQEEAKTLIQDANDLLMPVMTALELEKAVAPGIGSLLFTPSKKSTGFSKKLASEYLLKKGVKATMINEAFAHATTESYKPEVRFNAPK